MTLKKMADRKQKLNKSSKGVCRAIAASPIIFSVIFTTLLVGGDSKNGSGHLFVAVGIILSDMDCGGVVGSET